MTNRKIMYLVIILSVAAIVSPITYFYQTKVNKLESDYDQQSKVVEKLKLESAAFNKSYSDLKSDVDLIDKFQNERCVCVPWQNSGIGDDPLTKKDICSLKEDKNSVYPIIYSWTPSEQ